ncbi:MAG: EscN/YscN/HrcN family type III secretion system ATPase, partial [Planctomycetaceae bacterium]|nr:EscN/YscN/HrcN family type III secretion system ATPase [Planctomycetaceae bacterium]
AMNHYPAVDVLASVSRVMNAIIDDQHLAAAGQLRQLLAKYQEVEMLIKLGEYKPGSDPVTDEAVRKIELINSFLRQETHEQSTWDETVWALTQLME